MVASFALCYLTAILLDGRINAQFGSVSDAGPFAELCSRAGAGVRKPSRKQSFTPRVLNGAP